MQKIISLAPARLCLFGEHQDYLHLPVIACAIDRYMQITAIKNDSHIFRIQTPLLKKEKVLNINASFEEATAEDIFSLSLKVLKKYKYIPNQGYDIKIDSHIPINAGLSSSTALIISWINFLIHAFPTDTPVDSEKIAQLAHQIEVTQNGGAGGKMDQYSISIGGFVFINTVDNSYEKIHTDLEGLIVAESGIPKDTDGVLNEVKKNIHKATKEVSKKIKDFQLITACLDDFSFYSQYVNKKYIPYFYGTLKNYDITKTAFRELKKEKPNIKYIGSLMNTHHEVLKKFLQVSTEKIDKMVACALDAGAVGAKIVGSGRGGSIVALAPNREKEVLHTLKKMGIQKAYRVKISSGTIVKIKE